MREERGVITIAFWASVTLMVVLTILSVAAPGLREVWSFNLLAVTCAALAMVSSAFLFLRERRINRQQMRALRRESRDISREEETEWTPKELLYVAAFLISFMFVWYLGPNVLLTF
jgi:quinol-cytochrome oxidoreductase complex cytochrome b subunit